MLFYSILLHSINVRLLEEHLFIILRVPCHNVSYSSENVSCLLGIYNMNDNEYQESFFEQKNPKNVPILPTRWHLQLINDNVRSPEIFDWKRDLRNAITGFWIPNEELMEPVLKPNMIKLEHCVIFRRLFKHLLAFMHQTYQPQPEECGENLCFFILQNRTGIKCSEDNLHNQTQ